MYQLQELSYSVLWRYQAPCLLYSFALVPYSSATIDQDSRFATHLLLNISERIFSTLLLSLTV